MHTMTKVASCLLTACLLAACGKNEAPAPATMEPSAGTAKPAPAIQPRAVPAAKGERGADILAAAGVEFAFPHKVLYDILDSSKSGTPRHRVLVEVQSGNFDAIVDQFGQSLTNLGYKKASDKNEGGRIQQVYAQAGKPTYYLLMQPAGMGPKLHDAGSVGSIHVMWNIPRGS